MAKEATARRRVNWYWVITLYSATASSFVGALVLRAAHAREGQKVSFIYGLAWQAPVNFLWAAFVPVILWAGRRFRLARGAWAAPLPAYVFASIPLIFAHAAFTVWVAWLLEPATVGARPGFDSVFGPALVERLPIDLLIYWAIVGLLYAGEFYARYGERERAAVELEAQLARAQLHALRMQLNPHFLFNALQALSVLIRKDPEAATRMTARLGDLLRKTLSKAEAQEVALGEELELLRDYLAVEQVRFSDRLKVEYDVEPDALPCKVPDLILQPLVENALKHGLAPRPGPARLSVRARLEGARLVLEVWDDGAGLAEGWEDGGRDGVGLATTRARLQGLYGARQRLTLARNEAGGTTARVELPASRGGGGLSGSGPGR